MNDVLKVLGLMLVIASCSQSPQTESISNNADYAKYLNTQPTNLEPLEKQEVFWIKKIVEEPRGFTFYEKLGSTYHQLFKKTGDVNYLDKADSVFVIAQKLTQGRWKIPSLLSLSSLAIKKHDFQKAVTYAVMANELTEEKFGPLLMQFDAEMELGNYQMARAILDKTKRMNSFDYLVRLSKYKDHEGDLDSAIYYMEKANGLILRHQKEQKLWATANLADMYGHAGRIKDSYANYLKVLTLDSTYDYAMKGIAWVAYSHDRNTIEAREILKNLQQKTALPDYFLLLAEISELEEKKVEAENYKDLFLVEAGKSKYGGMYNKYVIDILIGQNNFDEAIKLAEEEVSKRPNPATYDWLGWTLFNQGKSEEAIKIYRENVQGETFEPEVIYHMGVVYHALGISEGQDYLEESLQASYELGPLVTLEIKSRLKG
ncbi:hypothetical protein [Ekhidna sp.]|uniref:tetratricopeptide repeat protein n=1 Tax=Ekhidna sp. TaxID=2608089 RepID=UPI003299AB89